MATSKRNALVCLKSFGDMTIAAKAIHMLYEEDAESMTLLIGSHHFELCKALNPRCKVEIVELRYPGVPAFYDVKDKGVIKFANSFLNAYIELSKHKKNFDELFFDSLTLREKLLSVGSRSTELKKGGLNIYQNYRDTFKQIFGRVKAECINQGPSKNILIFPYGRKSFRNIPSEIIDNLSKKCLLNGFKPKVYRLDSDVEIMSSIPDVLVEKPSFIKMRKAIEESCAIVSADSLPAHLATYVARPVFIASPYHKTSYWLPPYSNEHQFWGLFDQQNQMMDAFNRFLGSLQQ